jgi:hypothetical protein
MQELINSFVRLSAAMTVYSMQQVQTAVESVDPRETVTKLQKMIDSMTDALVAQIEESKKPALDSMSNLGKDMVGKTFDTINMAAMSPRDIVQQTGEIVKKTTDSLASMIRSEEKKSSGEPQAAEAALAASHGEHEHAAHKRHPAEHKAEKHGSHAA